MNYYRVWYTYTEPSEDCPEVLVTGGYIDTHETSHSRAKKYVSNDCYLNRIRDNFKVMKSELLEKDIHLLKRNTIGDEKHIEGVAASFKFEGEEIVVTAKRNSKLQDVGVKLFGRGFTLNKEQIRPIAITQKQALK